MRWLRENGVISSYDDYVGLPLRVLQDARLLMAAEAQHLSRERARASQNQKGARNGFRR
ncbi:MAG: hypothetical protein IT301_05240 [Dehalococcoidia bacterium]|nr:hypothetical protein [Dehalococcoidia bacterium]